MDYNLLKRQVQDFPFMLDQAITQAKQEVSEQGSSRSTTVESHDAPSPPSLLPGHMVPLLFSLLAQICQVISEVSSTNQELLHKYKREMNLRKKCHNELVRLRGLRETHTHTASLTHVQALRWLTRPLCCQGNMRVFCRVRPVSQEQQECVDARSVLSFDSEDEAVLYLSSKGRVMRFELDKVFPPPATQEEVGHMTCQLAGRVKPSSSVTGVICPPGVPGSPVSGHFLYRWL